MGGGATNAIEARLYSTCVIMPNLIALCETVWAYVVEIRKVSRDAWPVETHFFPICVIIPIWLLWVKPLNNSRQPYTLEYSSPRGRHLALVNYNSLCNLGLHRVGQNKPDCFSESITLRRLVVEGVLYVKSFQILS